MEDAPGIETAAVVIAGRDGIIAFASPAVRELLRYEPDWLVGRPIELLVPEAFAKRHRAGWNRTWRRGELPPPKSPVMIPVACGDGEVRRVPGLDTRLTASCWRSLPSGLRHPRRTQAFETSPDDSSRLQGPWSCPRTILADDDLVLNVIPSKHDGNHDAVALSEGVDWPEHVGVEVLALGSDESGDVSVVDLGTEPACGMSRSDGPVDGDVDARSTLAFRSLWPQ